MGELSEKGGGSMSDKPWNDERRGEKKKREWLNLYCAGGISAREVCDKVGIIYTQVSIWKREDANFLKLFNKTRLENYHKWPPCLGVRIGEVVDEKTIARRKAKIMAKKAKNVKKRHRKDQIAWLKSYEKLSFNATEVCRSVGISRRKFDRWRQNDKSFDRAYLEATEAKKDFIESQLMKNIEAGDSQSIIFACKTKLKDRGYVERKEIEHGGEFGVMVSPGSNSNSDDWEKSAMAQQAKLAEKVGNGEGEG